MIVMKITNVVAKAMISGFNKDIILEKINHAEYRPNNFPAICTRERNGIIISLFDSGKVTSAGANSTDSAVQSLHHFIKRIRKFGGMKISILSEPLVSLIVSHVSFGKRIDLDRLRGMRQFKKEVKRFSSIQMTFPNNVNVQAYDTSLVVSGDDVSEMTNVVKSLERHTLEEKM